ncbi:MAG: Gfo/Idh/MocA family oxidoreductase [Alphaproteobacteria bacterium]|nr:Gfo/Idh/MocA family oxidoreductase [Alphaproteobacteria bacterium]
MTETGTKLRWGIIGPGIIAKTFADGLAHSRTGTLVAIGTNNPHRPGLAEKFPGARILKGYQALIDDPEVEAIYIATPHPIHAEWAIKCAEGKKHVLCEKPIGLSAFEAEAIFHAARKAGTFMGEAFMYRLHPQTVRLLDLIRDGVIGDVRLIKSSFGFAMPRFDPKDRSYANDLAGGGILDVGCYPVSMSRLIVGATRNLPFVDPQKVAGTAYLGTTGVDEWASALLTFPGGIIAEVSGSVSVVQDNMLRIIGTKGRIEVADFWFGSGHEGGVGKIEIILNDGTRKTVEVNEPRWLYSFEADAVADAIAAGNTEFSSPGMSWADTMGNMAVLDKWLAEAGLVYEIEKPARRKKTLRGDKLAVGPDPMKKRAVPGLSIPCSPVALGFEFFDSFAAGAILLDGFYERGGNLFDTGFIYANGATETIWGDWHTSRGLNRSELLVIAKGAHSPLCYPDVIGKQLEISLDRLQTDYVDIYFLHRDNPDIPVGEFVDALDVEVKKGRIRGPVGGSNWSMERIDAANDYATRHGRTPMAALSNNFSLAEMVKPIWEGCVAASSEQWKSWLSANQMPNFAWSSQGRGFFTDRAGPDKTGDRELVDTWYSNLNFARRDRAMELAKELGCSPIHIALAYVLAQPFPVVPLIGPRSLFELEDSLNALDIKLSPAQVKWLERVTDKWVPVIG